MKITYFDNASFFYKPNFRLIINYRHFVNVCIIYIVVAFVKNCQYILPSVNDVFLSLPFLAAMGRERFPHCRLGEHVPVFRKSRHKADGLPPRGIKFRDADAGPPGRSPGHRYWTRFHYDYHVCIVLNL